MNRALEYAISDISRWLGSVEFNREPNLMSDDLDMAKARGNYGLYQQVCSAVFHAVGTSELLVELGLADNEGKYIEPPNSHTLQKLMTDLVSMSRRPEAAHRSAAAKALGAAALCSETLVSEAEASLISLISHADEGTAVAAIEALGRMASKGTPRLVSSLVGQLADERPDRHLVTSAILEALQKCDPVAASLAVPSLIGIVDQSERPTNVRVSACAILGAIGQGAFNAIPALLKASRHLSEATQEFGADLAKTAAGAIARIDREALQTVAAAKKLEDLECVRQLLLTSGEPTDQDFVRNLTRSITALQIGPPADRRRMRIGDIITDIYGTLPGNADTRRKNILGWIAAKTLPGMQISRGVYDVDAAALQVFRARHSVVHDAESP